MERVPNKDRAGLVGDPFGFVPDPPPRDEHIGTNEHKPMKTVVVLIEFSSSGPLARSLRRSSFISYEDIVTSVRRQVPIVNGPRLQLHPRLGFREKLPEFLTNCY